MRIKNSFAVTPLGASTRILTRSLAVCTVALLMCGSPVMAQFDSGSIQGTVLDPSGAHVPGVQVSLVNSGTGINLKTETNEDGI